MPDYAVLVAANKHTLENRQKRSEIPVPATAEIDGKDPDRSATLRRFITGKIKPPLETSCL